MIARSLGRRAPASYRMLAGPDPRSVIDLIGAEVIPEMSRW
jgi:hypothetical protein